MYKIAICDDDGAFASALASMLSQMFQERGVSCHVTLFSDPFQMLAALERGESCDLLFQDILFGEEKGIHFARLLRERQWDIDLVFVTSSARYAVDSYDVHPLHYLLKPVRREQLADVLDRFLALRSPRMLTLPTPQGTLRLPTANVLYFEIYNHTVVIHRTDGGSSSWRCTLRELEGRLPPDCFVRTHRSFLVNLEHIAAIERGQLRLTTGEILPISKNAYTNVQLGLAAFDHRRHYPS